MEGEEEMEGKEEEKGEKEEWEEENHRGVSEYSIAKGHYFVDKLIWRGRRRWRRKRGKVGRRVGGGGKPQRR